MQKTKLKAKIIKLRNSTKNYTLKEIAEKVGLRDKQWVYYHLNSDRILKRLSSLKKTNAKKENKTGKTKRINTATI